MKEKILHLLKEYEKSFISGQRISKELGVTRTAVWKYINILKEDGYKIESVSKRGYRLISSPDLLSFEELNEKLITKYIGRNIMYFQTLGSTNNKAKELALSNAPHGTVIISEEQTEGRGRLGRNWSSPKFKGIWLSIILRPDTDPLNVPKVTQVGAAAVIKALNELDINAYVKWPNDIILNEKKVCGILTEMSGELNKVNYVVMGIGINVNTDSSDFPEELKNTATSISLETGKYIKRKELVSKLLNSFELLYDEFEKEETIKTSVSICKKNSILLGKEIKIINRGKETYARAVDLSDEGELMVQYTDGIVEKIVSGEVSIRGLTGSYTPR
ncbi:biotin--[acetyl-CoA-carboxylase] ligase [Clostridium sp. A1-XYC3]|uniref:Bifunctional ligase/repressor BirA n=1 Tax=Clostridium tanneri TaxID=3037988 RepID=A0ABU4JT74_9CLOT|nr:biotin--[acetyl-CoA-carboxylase] ligase [Clostridium sp. A1-XYC3]MDW8801365.1 biotin--[acetyl-CoA-carboxylase] ligase [Clostridium sp. A1-XYC3]